MQEYLMFKPQDSPGGPVVRTPASGAGVAGSMSGWGTRIPHATGQLRLRATTPKPPASTREAASCQLQSPRTPEPASYPGATGKTPHAATKAQGSQK